MNVKALLCFILPILSFNIALSSGSDRYKHKIYIDPKHGNDTTKCNHTTPCKSLNWAFKDRQSSTKYILFDGIHYLNNSTVFQNLSSLAFIGNTSNVVIKCVGNNAGFAFESVEGIVFENLTIMNCSALRSSTNAWYINKTYGQYQLRAALYFNYCQDVRLSFTSVKNSSNAIGVVVYNTIGRNTFEYSNFSYNQINPAYNIPSGGGFFVEFSYCIPGDDTCNNNELPPSISRHNSNTNYTFHKCVFSHNTATSTLNFNGSSSTKPAYNIPKKGIHIATGHGGGLCIFFKGNASNNTFSISHSKFHHNEALWGGGLSVQFQDRSANNSINIQHSSFHHNKCPTVSAGASGGGIRIAHYVYESSTNLHGFRNSVLVKHSNLYNNSALEGGGLSIMPALQHTRAEMQCLLVNISNSRFLENTAEIGGAVHVTLFAPIVDGDPPAVRFSAVQFVSNCVTQKHKDMSNSNYTIFETGIGTVYTNLIDIQFRKNILFESNTGSALAVSGARADFMNSTATFVGNNGTAGGAIALLGAAFILVNQSTVMNFTENNAEVHGGAISNTYIERENFMTYSNCFIRHKDPFLAPEDWTAVFHFADNKATLNGDSIHSTSIMPCARAGGWGEDHKDEILCWKNWTYYQDGEETNCSSQLSSDSGDIKHMGRKSAVASFPGETIHLPLKVLDELKHDSSNMTVFTAKALESDIASVDPRYSFVSAEYIKVNGRGGNNVTLHLYTTGERIWHVELKLNLHDCPPGFKLSDEQKCVCNKDIDYGRRLRCNEANYTSKLLNGFWMGTTEPNGSHLVVSLCLPGFCNKDKQGPYFHLPQSEADIDWKMCGENLNRTGVLCGECLEGFGHAVNSRSFDCVRCNTTNTAAHTVYYILSVYVPLVLMFSALIVFNIRLTSAPANTFIFFVQVVSSNFDLNADGHIPLNLITNRTDVLLKAYRLPYGIFNLDFLESVLPPLCLGTNLNTLDALQLKYIVAVFPLVMIIVVVLIVKVKDCCVVKQKMGAESKRSNSFRKFKWRVGESLLHAFAAFVLLSYIKFSLTSSYLVNVHPVFDQNGTEVDTPRRVYYAGQFSTSDVGYILRYYIPGIIVLVLAALPPIVLLGYPVVWFEKCIIHIRWIWKLYPVDKVHILLDTFQGCYRDNRRFFAGVYFLFRLTINVIYILTDNWLQQFVVQQITCTVFILIIVVAWPYRKEYWMFNYVDLFIFTNLSVVNALSLYLYSYSQTNPGQPLPMSAFVVQYTLVFVPLGYMILYVMWRVLLGESQKEWLIQKFLSPFKKQKYNHLIVNSSPRKRSSRSLKSTFGFKKTNTNDTQNTATCSEVMIEEEEENEYSSMEDSFDAIMIRAKAENTYRSTGQSEASTLNSTDRTASSCGPQSMTDERFKVYRSGLSGASEEGTTFNTRSSYGSTG